MAIIVSAFPGTGKSFFFKNHNDGHVHDSDSSQFSWVVTDQGKVRNPDFPENYLKHIEGIIANDPSAVILTSSHKEVRNALYRRYGNNKEPGVELHLVVPNLHLRGEYLQRFRDRGNDENFIKLIEDSWNEFIKDSYSPPIALRVLDTGEYLSSIWPLLHAAERPDYYNMSIRIQ